MSSPGSLFPWADGGADGLFAATVSPSMARADPVEVGREADAVAGDLGGTTGPMPEIRTESADQPGQSWSGQDAGESESLSNLTSRLAAVAERWNRLPGAWCRKHDVGRPRLVRCSGAGYALILVGRGVSSTMVTYDGSNIFGEAVQFQQLAHPNAQQINTFFGVSGTSRCTAVDGVGCS